MSGMPAGSVPRTIALCYVRQSFTRDESSQHSPDRQKANITALCQQHGWKCVWFVDADGHGSGYGETKRPAWQQLKEWLHHPQVVAVVANEPSRVYRQMWRMGRLMEDLDQQRVQLRFASPSSPVRDISHSLPAERLESEVGHLIDLLCIPNDTLTALKQPFGDTNLEPVELPSEATRVKALTLYAQRLSRAKQLYLALDIDEEEYKRLTSEYRQVINRLKAAALTPTEYALHLEFCATKMRQMQSLWQTGPNPECRAALRDLFEEFVIDLDTERITSFRLKPWADSYLRACASVFTPQAYPCGGAQPLETVGSQSKLLEGSLEAVSRVILARLYADSPSAIVLPATEVRQVRNQALRRRHAEGETLSDLAREFRISPQRVHQIVRGKKR